MPIITVASTKGGVGKSTLVVNLAVALQAQGHAVSVLDADPQGTVMKWNSMREYAISEGERLPPVFVAQAEGTALIEIAQERAAKGDYVLVDTAGADSKNSRAALLRTNFVLTAVAPSGFDLWEVKNLTEIVGRLAMTQKRAIPVMLLFNKVSPNPSVKTRQEASDFIESFRHQLAHVFENEVKERIDLQHSTREGKGVSEYAPNSRAAQEIDRLARELTAFVTESQAKRPAESDA